MPAWSFQRRFERALENGLAEARGERWTPYPGVTPKRQTIRAERKDGRDPPVGIRMRIWIEQRTPERRLLGETPVLERRERIWIPHEEVLILQSNRLGARAILNLAIRDGFSTARQLFWFVEHVHGYPFRGYVYRW